MRTHIGSSAQGPLSSIRAVFAYRSFAVVWAGAFVSSIGTWMQSVAQSWLVLDLTRSAFYLGLDAFLAQLPIVLFTLIGGVMADRHSRRALLTLSQILQMCSALALAALVFFGGVRIWHVLALSFLTGTAQSFGGPAYQSLLPALVARRDLPTAIAFNSIQFSLARAIGPMVAGVTLAAFGTAACFGLNGVSYLAVVAALLTVRLPAPSPAPHEPMARELGEGLRYVGREPSLLALMALAFVTTSLGMSVLTLMPVYVQEVFGGSVGDYSRLMAWSGAGAVAGALFSAILGRHRRMGRLALLVQALAGGLIVALGFARARLAVEILVFLAGAALVVVSSALTSLVQLVASDRMRGRVMSIYMMAFRGGMPLGALASGYLATLTSAATTLAVSGTLLAAAAAVAIRRAPRIDSPA